MPYQCKVCGAEIRWIETANNKSQPLSVKSKQKRYVLIHDYDTSGPTSVPTGEHWELVDTYLSHFADCPKADMFRKRDD